MNGNDIFRGLKYVGDDLVEEAEFGKFPQRTVKTTFRGPLLAAALIAISLLLAGCAVAYVLHMQDMKVGEQKVTTPVFNEYMEFQGNETVSQQVLTLAGLKGTPSYQAAQEWFAFQSSYDLDSSIADSLRGNWPEYDHKYDAYGPYTQEMVDKLDAISSKYSLKFQGAQVKLHGGKRFYEEMGIDRILMPNSKATVTIKRAYGYENGSWGFNLFMMEMPEEDGQWPYRMTNCLYYNKKGCFSTDLAAIDDTGDWIDWNYTTVSGQNVLLMMSKSDYAGWIICDRADAMISVRVEVRNDVGYNEEGKQWFDSTYMSDKQFEKVADAIDFDMKPEYQGESSSEVDTSLAAQTHNGYTIAVKSVETDGYSANILLGITAPEGVTLIKYGGYSLRNGNWGGDWLAFDKGIGMGASAKIVDDQDGLANTYDFLIDVQPHFADGEDMPITKDSVWNLYFEDLIGYWWDSDSGISKEELLAEGAWSFDITFENIDTQEMEFVREPVKALADGGWSAKTGDIYENVEITSFKLRSLSAAITHTGGEKSLTGGPGHQIFVVMKDGTQVEVFGYNGQIYTLMSPIDLAQVDYILMPDGTKLLALESPTE